MLHECGDSVLQEEKVLDAGSTTLDILNTTEQHDQKRVRWYIRYVFFTVIKGKGKGLSGSQNSLPGAVCTAFCWVLPAFRIKYHQGKPFHTVHGNSTFRKRRSWHLVPSLHGKWMGKQWKQ